MAKRKNDCSLNDFVVDYLEKRKFETTLKLFDRDNEVMMEEKLDAVHFMCAKLSPPRRVDRFA